MTKPIGFYIDNGEGTIAESFSKQFGKTSTKLNDRERFFLIASLASHAYVGDNKMLGDDVVLWATKIKTHPQMNQATAARLIEFLSTGIYL